MGITEKSDFYREGGFLKNQYRGEDYLKRGLGQFTDLRWLDKKEGVVFLGGFDTPMHTMFHFIFISFQIFLKINLRCLKEVIAQ